MEPNDEGNRGNGGDGVHGGTMISNQYFNDLFIEIETDLYPGCTNSCL